MNLEDRDYTEILNDEEKNAYVEELAYEAKKGLKNTRNFPRFSHPNEDIRKFI